MEKKNKFSTKLLKVAAIALVFGLVAGGTFSGVQYLYSRVTDNNSSSVKVSTSDGVLDSTAVSTATTVTDVSDIVDNVMPAVVAVTNTSTVTYRSFFGGAQNYESKSAGSGIIFAQDDSKIYIATNNHVVSGASNLTITFYDEKEASAELVGTASSSDLAVVSVNLSDLSKDTISKIKTATIGDSTSLKVGESAVVIGNSLGYGQTVTTGIISALEREVSLQDEDDGTTYKASLIQTDAAVNPGNSGGALLNMNGQVVGIVSAKYSSTEVEGVGYAIPISQASEIISSIISGKSSTKTQADVYLGVSGVDVTRTTAVNYSMPTGVYVSKVHSDTGAEKAGIKKGDVICAIDGRDISSMDEISQYLKNYSPGDKITLKVAVAGNNYSTSDYEVTLSSK